MAVLVLMVYQQLATTDDESGSLKTRRTSMPTVTATSTADVTAGWKTYNNTEYGFIIKFPTDWQAIEDTAPKIYFAPKNAGDAILYVEKYSGSLTAGATELKQRLSDQFGNACGGPDATYSIEDINKFDTVAKIVEVTTQSKDCQDGKIIPGPSYTIIQSTFAVTTSKGNLLIWDQVTDPSYPSNSSGRISIDLYNSIIGTLKVQ